METDAAAALPVRGTKRKADFTHGLDGKRTRSVSPFSNASPSDADAGSPVGSFSSTSPAPVSSPATPAPLSTPSTPASSYPSRQKRLPCTWPGCTKLFSRPANLSEHLDAHKGNRSHKCPSCPKTFLHKKHLNRHINGAHEGIHNYPCTWPNCGLAFATGSRLNRHLEAHKNREPYTCKMPGCGQSFRKHKTLKQHVFEQHEGPMAFICEKPDIEDASKSCGIGFPTKGKLKGHVKQVHSPNQYYCTICTARPTFTGIAQLKRHNGYAHPPKCSKCPFTAKEEKELRKHLEAEHNIVRTEPGTGAESTLPTSAVAPIPCPRPGCDKTFSKQGNLSTHIARAHDGRRFVCGEVPLSYLKHVDGWTGSDACGRDFSAKCSLEGHIRGTHLGLATGRRKKTGQHDEPASKPPNRSVSTIAHLAGTSYAVTERPFACLVTGCSWRFTRAYDRDAHARTRHGLAEGAVAARSAAAGGAANADPANPQNPAPARACPAAQDPDEDPDWTVSLEQGAARGGRFWLGGGGQGDDDDEDDDDDYVNDDAGDYGWCRDNGRADFDLHDMWRVVRAEEDEFQHDPDGDDEDDEVTGLGGRIDPMLLG